jgi:hypothetical protein
MARKLNTRFNSHMAKQKPLPRQRQGSTSTKRSVKLRVVGPDGAKSPRDFLAGLPKGSVIEINGKKFPKLLRNDRLFSRPIKSPQYV